MAAINEILEFESSRDGLEMQRTIHLFQEGSFYRAYDWSAWLMCRYLHDFKVTHRRMKGIEQSVALIGFPVTSLSKWVTVDLERHDVSDKHITFTLSEDVFCDLGEGVNPDDVFNDWKASHPIVEKAARRQSDADSPQQHVMSLSMIAQRILSFPVEAKSPIDCYQFLSEIKQQIAKLF